METMHAFFRSWCRWMILLLALLLPFGVFTGLVTALLAVGWLLSGEWNEKWKRMRSAKGLWLWVAFYAWNLLSLAWSADVQEGSIGLQVKLALLICPLVLATIRFDVKRSRQVLAAFTGGLVLCGLFMLGRATWLYFSHGDANVFYYQAFSDRLIHPSYLSMYYCAGIMVLFHGLLLQSIPPRPWKVVAAALCFFFAIVVFLLSSKMGLLTMVLLFAGYIVYAVVRFRRYVVGGAALLVLVAGFFIAFKFFPEVSSRVDRLLEVFSSAGQPIDPAQVESNQVRLLIWKADYAIVDRHTWAGVGIGDVQDSLMGEYRARGMTGALDKALNAHSQLFQTAIACGLPGLFLLLGVVLYPAFRDRFGFSILFALLFLVNILPESMLEVQAGAIFFGFFYSLILFSIDRRCLTPLKAPSPVSFL